MATPASGTISLNQVHVEAGGSSGTQASFNDSDIRLISGSNQNTQFSMSAMYARAADFNPTSTVGTAAVTFSPTYVSFTDYYRGYSINIAGANTATNPTSEPDYMGGGTITRVSAQSSNVITDHRTINLESNAANTTNDDNNVFNSVVINSTTYDRGDFTFSTDANKTQLTKAETTGGFQDTTSTISPFPSNGTSYTISFRRRV